MTLRTIKSSIAFAAPFKLEGLEDEQPAGRYDVETDEEIIEGNGQTIYRRVATLLILRSHGLTRTVTVTPAELEAALARDTGG
ncbi:hypothetical protein [Sphingomonas oligoaromativorans]|uniref:hypothetical protein n=1 Tax=Sphingomonas oligoaromativorans TaxID=575322 RepID=UPI00141DBC4D|nr:hypothetical protein [Sphingomonas oligoaromativorans]NIJ35307.1 hypothetical protein [Sphingomonas oligoaromativorans]